MTKLIGATAFAAKGPTPREGFGDGLLGFPWILEGTRSAARLFSRTGQPDFRSRNEPDVRARGKPGTGHARLHRRP